MSENPQFFSQYFMRMVEYNRGAFLGRNGAAFADNLKPPNMELTASTAFKIPLIKLRTE